MFVPTLLYRNLIIVMRSYAPYKPTALTYVYFVESMILPPKEHPFKAHLAIHTEYAPPYEYPTENNGIGFDMLG